MILAIFTDAWKLHRFADPVMGIKNVHGNGPNFDSMLKTEYAATLPAMPKFEVDGTPEGGIISRLNPSTLSAAVIGKGADILRN